MLVLRPHQACKQIICSSLFQLHLCRSSSSPSPSAGHTHPIQNLFLPNSISTLKSLLGAHSLIITSGQSSNIFLAAKLISLYSSFNKTNLATQVFNEIPTKDTFSWNSIIQAHYSNAKYETSISFFLRMRRSHCVSNHFTIPMVVASCTELPAIKMGQSVHGFSLKMNLTAGNCAIGSSLIHFYAKCGCLDNAQQMFDDMPTRDVVAWTALVVGYVQNGDCEMGLSCLQEMHSNGDGGVKPNFRTMEGGLQACRNLEALLEGKCLHGFIVKTGIGSCSFVQSSLLSMYSKCGSVEQSHIAFDELPNKDLISWTALISVYARNGLLSKCFELFQDMQASGIDPDAIVISCLVMGSGNITSFNQGKCLHGLLVRKSFDSDTVVCNSLISMYCKFKCLDIAEKIFKIMTDRDSETWNFMISGYGKMGLETKCIEMFREMQPVGLEFDSNSLVAVVSSCSQLSALQLGRSVHCSVIKAALDEDVSILNSLVGMYGRCGNFDVAQRIFRRMWRDTITWNTLISAYVHSGHCRESLLLFDQMLSENVRPNSATLVSVLSACSYMAALKHGEWIHKYVKEMGFEYDVSLSTALVDMYAKCGQPGISRGIFDGMPKRDVISWNAMISGYGVHGKTREALEIFQQMEESSERPNEVTFLAILSACSHAGLVEEGKQLFGRMKHYSIMPSLKHYSCMVDLLGRSGNLCEAESMILTMPMTPDGGVWGALLSACKVHGNVEMGERVAKKAFESDPENDGYYMLLSNMYSSIGRWEEAEKVRGVMKKRSVRKIAGWSAMELGEDVFVFLVGDKSHPQSEEIYKMLEALFRPMEECGYVVQRGSGVLSC